MAGDKIVCAQRLPLTCGDETVLIEPHAPNIVRVSLSLRRDDALAAPGSGISAKSSPSGWTAEKDKSGDVLQSSRMVVTVSPKAANGVPSGTQADIATSFNGSAPGVSLSIRTPESSPWVESSSQLSGREVPRPSFPSAPDLPRKPPFQAAFAAYSK
jgi:alpha-D-xyloside xylohydrolase